MTLLFPFAFVVMLMVSGSWGQQAGELDPTVRTEREGWGIRRWLEGREGVAARRQSGRDTRTLPEMVDDSVVLRHEKSPWPQDMT
jgi:hypothetical protein